MPEMILPRNELLIPNFGAIGLPSRTPFGVADLEVIWMTPYPVITNYMKLCDESDLLTAFGGGSREQQLHRISGYITSGYRPGIVGMNFESPHRYAIALDVIVGDAQQQVEVGEIALKYFTRVGLYPGKGIIHIDMAPPSWIAHHKKSPFWTYTDDQYFPFDNFTEAAEMALAA